MYPEAFLQARALPQTPTHIHIPTHTPKHAHTHVCVRGHTRTHIPWTDAAAAPAGPGPAAAMAQRMSIGEVVAATRRALPACDTVAGVPSSAPASVAARLAHKATVPPLAAAPQPTSLAEAAAAATRLAPREWGAAAEVPPSATASRLMSLDAPAAATQLLAPLACDAAAVAPSRTCRRPSSRQRNCAAARKTESEDGVGGFSDERTRT